MSWVILFMVGFGIGLILAYKDEINSKLKRVL